MKLAIIIGVSEYQHCQSLNACDNDIKLMRSIFERLEKFEDICVIDNSPKAFEAKKKLTDFINKYKEDKVEELVFYYTGHGARYDNDFFYIFSDFNEDKKEVTGLRNTELDGLIRNLSPDLTVKIVDACYSGTNYVKSDTDIDIQPFLEKSAEENHLRNLYFFHSSSSEETSFASPLHSYFTYSFCKSLIENEGSIRYRDIMAFVADDMASQNLPKPTFIVQANNTEYFGKIDLKFIKQTKAALQISDKLEGTANHPIDIIQTENSLLDLVELKSVEEYCSYDEASSNIEQIRDKLAAEFWPNDIKTIFDIEQTEIDSISRIPNVVEIGQWLQKKSANSFFAEPSFKVVKFHKEEYVEIPKKPNSSTGSLSSRFGIASLRLGSESITDKDYKLEKVEKRKHVVDGFRYTADSPFKAIKLQFIPKRSAAENYCLTMVILFSMKSLAIFSAKECLEYRDWQSVIESECTNWKVELLMLKDLSSIIKYVETLISDMSQYIVEDITKKLNE